MSHLELGWALPAEREFYEGLASGRTLVRYDRPGCGLSGSTARPDVVELELEVLQRVAEAVGPDRFDLIGASFGAPLAVRWAAGHPESVSKLILYGGWVDGAVVAPPAVAEHVLGLVDQHWGFASDVLTAGIAGAILTVLPGRTHIPFAGDAHSLLNAVRRGCTGFVRRSSRSTPTSRARPSPWGRVVTVGARSFTL